MQRHRNLPVPDTLADVCNSAAAKRSLDALATAGDAILTDISTITGLLDQATAREPGPRASGPGGHPRRV